MPTPKINPVGQSEKIKLLVFGRPGAGKTTLIGTCPNPAKTLIIRPQLDNVDPIRDSGVQETIVSSWPELDDVSDYLRMEVTDEWEWVWMDSLSIWQSVGLDDIWKGVLLSKPHRKTYGLDKGEYGVNMERIGQFVRLICGLSKFNVGFTAHPAELTAPNGETLLMPYIQGKNMADQVCGYMNLVAYLDVEARSPSRNATMKRVLHTAASDDWYAKDAFNKVPARIEDPTIPKIVGAINGSPARAAKRKPTIKRSGGS